MLDMQPLKVYGTQKGVAKEGREPQGRFQTRKSLAFLFFCPRLQSSESLIYSKKQINKPIKTTRKMSKTTRIIKGTFDTCAFLAGAIEVFLFTKDHIVPVIKKLKTPAAEEAVPGES